MARKRVVKQERPTITDLKGLTGILYVIRCAGYTGGISVKAPRKRLDSDVDLEDLMIAPWEWRPLDEAWLDVPGFRAVYMSHSDIEVKRLDGLPERFLRQELPKRLDDTLSRENKIIAWELANEPDIARARRVIFSSADEFEHTPARRVGFVTEKLDPFLRAFRIYEERCGNRQAVIKMIDERLKQIEQFRKIGDTMVSEPSQA